METDVRIQSAKYYDLNPNPPKDIPFYRSLISSADVRVLELGCGTGRVLLPLAEICGYIHGLDLSEAMITVCREKLIAAGIPTTKARVKLGDISNFAVNQRFDLILAAYRVLQNLETDTAVEGLFECVGRHLAPNGSCILNVFNPKRDPDTLRSEWCTDSELLSWELNIEGGRVTCHERRPRMDADKLVLYPELIYRRYQGKKLVDEAVLKIAMRCYYPEEFVQLIVRYGFRVLNRWGGYAGEPYGKGPELVVQFAPGN
jgi:SAM-dependent methyltransferase